MYSVTLMSDALYADDVDALAEKEQELGALVEPAQGIRWRSVLRRPN